MSQKSAKLLRKFCKSVGFQYNKTKKAFKNYDKHKKAWMFEEMRAGLLIKPTIKEAK
jgi:hypothetical protein